MPLDRRLKEEFLINFIRSTLLGLAAVVGYGWLRGMKKRRAGSLTRQMVSEQVLQRYLDRMSDYVREPEFHDRGAGEQLRNLARAHTLTTCARLDPDRKGLVVRFLCEAGLIGGAPEMVSEPLIILQHANLRGARLVGANLGWVNLVAADLSYADLRGAFLAGANLGGADLIGANLSGATLTGANLILADLRGCNFEGVDRTEVLVTEGQLRWARNVG